MRQRHEKQIQKKALILTVTAVVPQFYEWYSVSAKFSMSTLQASLTFVSEIPYRWCKRALNLDRSSYWSTCKVCLAITLIFLLPVGKNSENWKTAYHYSRIPITRTFSGNRKRFELSRVRVSGSWEQMTWKKEKRWCCALVFVQCTF